jgi:hypothetical protein
MDTDDSENAATVAIPLYSYRPTYADNVRSNRKARSLAKLLKQANSNAERSNSAWEPTGFQHSTQNTTCPPFIRSAATPLILLCHLLAP